LLGVLNGLFSKPETGKIYDAILDTCSTGVSETVAVDATPLLL
jgi:hypothetical protein